MIGTAREQVDDDLRAPVRHLAPRQQVAEERLGHQAQVDEAAEDPRELARLPVAAVHQAAEHVQVDDDEEHRRAGRMHVADQPAPRDVAHDVLDGLERLGGVGLVAHREEDAGDDLHHEHEGGERAEVVPEVEVLRRDVLAPLRFPERGQREARIDPLQKFFHGREIPYAVLPSWPTPISTFVSERNRYGGITRLVGAGTPL